MARTNVYRAFFDKRYLFTDAAFGKKVFARRNLRQCSRLNRKIHAVEIAVKFNRIGLLMIMSLGS